MEKIDFKKLEPFYNRYLESDIKWLRDCYGSYSDRKHNAFNYCLNLCQSLNGRDWCIISHNRTMFTFGFMFENEQREKCFAYITKTKDWYAVIEEEEE